MDANKYYKTACVKTIIEKDKPNTKLRTVVGVEEGGFGFYNRDRIHPSGIREAANWEDNGVYSDLERSDAIELHSK